MGGGAAAFIFCVIVYVLCFFRERKCGNFDFKIEGKKREEYAFMREEEATNNA
jgi:hypothetical protein